MKKPMAALILWLSAAMILSSCSSGSLEVVRSAEDASLLSGSSWEQVVDEAKGQQVNWYLWGGSDVINSYVDQTVGRVLKDEYGVTLKRIPVNDTAEAVNKVLNEKQAGRHEEGSVDLIWINGENFNTLKQAEALFGPFAEILPNAQYVDYSNPAIQKDFGNDTEGMESVWGSAQFQFVYNASTVDPDELPRSYEELKVWIQNNPGRFTYNAPPDFIGTRFVKQLFYELSGGYEQWEKPLDQAEFKKAVEPVWSYLNEIKPHLWRGGETYPKSIAELQTLFNNNEVDFTFVQDLGGIQAEINKGRMPETARPYVFRTGTIGDYHYVAIPYNAKHKAAAMVTANLLLEPEMQFKKMGTQEGWGDGLGIHPAKLEGEAASQYKQIQSDAGETAVPAEDLLKHKLPDLSPAYNQALEEGWRKYVLFQK
ncbi:ABC transporter substrate-binding protein [Paenibacillus sp. F411]|uniref:ABC transporter substrate-binding protein n=1 Tax=Paenibacillus sp. F411 TaxID=2820239 RepID=UPI001AAF10F9|nr:ABC transporter substrate-binding protein [Paenibacillus sp. F411]MBO2942836.1 ABC transporter substrate-binding protein [Paenibacillus sp. F411]